MKKFVFSLSLFLCSFIQISAQELSAEIQQINQVLKLFSVDSVANLYDYHLLSKKVQLREKVVYKLSEEIDKVNYEIAVSIARQKDIEDKIAATRQEFEKLLLLSYKNLDLYSQFGFVFSAQNFNQAFKRFLFLQELTAFQKFQLDLLESYTKEVHQFDSTVLVLRNSQKQLLALKTDEKVRLNKAIRIRQSVQLQVKNNSGRFSGDLKKEKTSNMFINEAIAGGITMYKTSLGKEEPLVLSRNDTINRAFFDQKGKLASPVDSSIVVSFFGRQKHPVLDNVLINNDGIVYRTPKGSKIKSVFRGTVAKVFQIPGAKNAILIAHGNYFTLYANVDNVEVEENTNVKVGDLLGVVASSGNYGLLKFQIWKERDRLDPGQWLNNYL